MLADSYGSRELDAVSIETGTMDWFQISLLLCVCGFLKEIRPSEPYVSDFLQSPYRDVSTEELIRYILPIATYATVIFAIFVLLITDYLRYKVVIVSMGICGTITSALLLWTTSFAGAQWIEIVYAAYMTQEVAYFAYIYARVPREHFLTVTSHSRAALLFGRCMSGVIAHLFIYLEWMDIRQLNYITLGAQVASAVVALALPRVPQSIYFHRDASAIADNLELNAAAQRKPGSKYAEAFRLIGQQFVQAYTNRQVVLWSVWYACGLCGFLQVLNYVQSLWIAIDNRPEVNWNGAVDAVIALLCTLVALLASRMHSNTLSTKFAALSSLCVLSLGVSGSIFCLTNLGSRLLSYVAFMAFYVFHTFTITISSAEIAKRLPEDSYGLIFGINTLVSYCLQSLLTAIVVTDAFSMDLSIYGQFNVYGGFYVCLALIYLSYTLVDMIRVMCTAKEKGQCLADANAAA